jgi:adenylate cyclase
LPAPESQLGVPLLVRRELLGVLCAESEEPYRFHEEDKAACEVLGGYVAIAMQNMLLQERAEEHREPVPAAAPLHGVNGKRTTVPRREVCYYASDECILVDGEYLIRRLPAKILWKILRARACDGRSEFTNRELRLDKSLQLPDNKDNLETRRLLLRRRLEQECPDIRLVPCARGRFAVDLRWEVALVEKP